MPTVAEILAGAPPGPEPVRVEVGVIKANTDPCTVALSVGGGLVRARVPKGTPALAIGDPVAVLIAPATSFILAVFERKAEK